MRKAGVWVGIFILIVAVAAFKVACSYVYYGKYGPGPGLFPLWISGLFIAFALMYIFESIRHEGISIRELLPKGKELNYILRIMGSIALFIVIIPYTGYNIAGILMLLILFYGYYKWYWAVGIAIVSTLVLFMLFQRILAIPLPVNTFGW